MFKKLLVPLDRARARRIGDVDTHVMVAHDVEQAIVDFALASAVDAIAMSTHGRGASRLLFGSVKRQTRNCTVDVSISLPGESNRSADTSFT